MIDTARIVGALQRLEDIKLAVGAAQVELKQALELAERPFHDGQRIRHRHGGQRGTVVGTNVRKDGDSFYSPLFVHEWEPV